MKINLQYRNTNFLISLDINSIKVEELKKRLVNTLKEIIKNKDSLLKSNSNSSKNNLSNNVVNNSTGLNSSLLFTFKLKNVLVSFSRNFEDFLKEIETLSNDISLIKLFNTNDSYDNSLIYASNENKLNNINTEENKLNVFKELKNDDYIKSCFLEKSKSSNTNNLDLEKNSSSKTSTNNSFKVTINLKVVCCNGKFKKIKETFINKEESTSSYDAINSISAAEYDIEDKTIEKLITYCTGAETPLKEFKKTGYGSSVYNNRGSFEGLSNNSELLNILMSLRNPNNSSNNNLQSRHEILNRILLPLINNSNSDLSSDSDVMNSQSSNNSNFRVEIGNNNSNSLLINNSLIGSFNNNINNRPVNVSRPPVVANADMINQLVEMGFEEVRARRALVATRNNIEANLAEKIGA